MYLYSTSYWTLKKLCIWPTEISPCCWNNCGKWEIILLCPTGKQGIEYPMWPTMCMLSQACSKHIIRVTLQGSCLFFFSPSLFGMHPLCVLPYLPQRMHNVLMQLEWRWKTLKTWKLQCLKTDPAADMDHLSMLPSH